MNGRHLIADRRVELVIGLAMFVVGAVLLRDAYDNRGVKQPLVLRPFTFW